MSKRITFLETRLMEVIAQRDEYKAEAGRLREFVEHVANQRTYLTGNPYSSMARAALSQDGQP